MVQPYFLVIVAVQSHVSKVKPPRSLDAQRSLLTSAHCGVVHHDVLLNVDENHKILRPMFL